MWSWPLAERFGVMPWDMGRLTHREIQGLEELIALEAAEARAAKRRL